MGEGNEARLIGRGGEVNPLAEAAPEEFFEELKVLLHDVIDIHDLAVGEEEAEHRADPVEPVRNPFFRKELTQTFFEMRSKLIKAPKARAVVQLPELGESGRHRKGIPAECPCLIDRTERRKQVHHIRTTAKGSDRQSAADDFSETTEIGR